jgi:T-complex protein 1 subunit epsilon
MRAFSEALDAVPMALAENSGLSPIETLANIKSRQAKEKNTRLGVDCMQSGSNGKCICPSVFVVPPAPLAYQQTASFLPHRCYAYPPSRYICDGTMSRGAYNLSRSAPPWGIASGPPRVNRFAGMNTITNRDKMRAPEPFASLSPSIATSWAALVAELLRIVLTWRHCRYEGTLRDRPLDL